MNYKNLEIWKLAREVVIDIHRMTLEDLPKFEFYEEGAQIRKSSKSVKSNIVEGFGRRRYKLDFIHFLVFAESSADETIDHLETLYETGSIKSESNYLELHKKSEILAKKINKFISSVEANHKY